MVRWCGLAYCPAYFIFVTQTWYPIMDFRALWSLKNEVPKTYGFNFWQEYTSYCRDLSSVRAFRCAHWTAPCGSSRRKTVAMTNTAKTPASRHRRRGLCACPSILDKGSNENCEHKRMITSRRVRPAIARIHPRASASLGRLSSFSI